MNNLDKEKIYNILLDDWNINERIEIEDEYVDQLLIMLAKAKEVSVDEEGGLVLGFDDEDLGIINNE